MFSDRQSENPELSVRDSLRWSRLAEDQRPGLHHNLGNHAGYA